MDVAGEYTFNASQERVWAALQDPEVLAQVMPGGEEFKEVGENEYEGALNIKVGPVQGKFKGNIKLEDIDPPNGYSMTVDGKGAPGFVKANGTMKLNGDAEQTHMTYEGTARVGGRIASVGQRLLDSSARSIIRQSLEGLDAYLQAEEAAEQAAAQAEAAGASEEEAAAAREAARAEAPHYTPPSQTEVAMNVARDVFTDFVPPERQPAVLILAALVVGFILGRLTARR